MSRFHSMEFWLRSSSGGNDVPLRVGCNRVVAHARLRLRVVVPYTLRILPSEKRSWRKTRADARPRYEWRERRRFLAGSRHPGLIAPGPVCIVAGFIPEACPDLIPVRPGYCRRTQVGQFGYVAPVQFAAIGTQQVPGSTDGDDHQQQQNPDQELHDVARPGTGRAWHGSGDSQADVQVPAGGV